MSTGNLALDMILSGRCDGTGGWEIGKVCELFGPAQSGKSYLILRSVANFQKKYQGRPYFVFYDDIDNGVDPSFAEKIGVNFSENILVTSLHTKAAHDLTREAFSALGEKVSTVRDERKEFIRDGFGSSQTIEAAFQRIWGFTLLIDVPALYIIDPLSKLSCEFELKHGLQREDQGKRAKAVHASMRILPGRIHAAKALFLIANHPVTGPNDQYTPKLFKKTSAGTGLVTTADVRMEFANVKDIDIGTKRNPKIVGVHIHVTTIKNRGAYPFQEATIPLFWNQVVPRYGGLLSKLVELGFVEQGGGWYSFPNRPSIADKKFRSKEFEEICRENPELLREISDEWMKEN